MRKTTKLFLTILSFSSLSTLSYAAIPGIYLGAGAGLSALETPKEKLFNGKGAEENSRDVGGLGGRVFAGYNFNQYIGIELGATHYASSKYKFEIVDPTNASQTLLKGDATYSANAIDLVAKAYLPIGESGFNVYALGGAALIYASNDFNAKFYGKSSPEKVDESVSQHKLRPKYGVGISYDVPETPVTASLEFSRIQGTGDLYDKKQKDFITKGSGIANADMVSLNLAYNFG